MPYFILVKTKTPDRKERTKQDITKSTTHNEEEQDDFLIELDSQVASTKTKMKTQQRDRQNIHTLVDLNRRYLFIFVEVSYI